MKQRLDHNNPMRVVEERLERQVEIATQVSNYCYIKNFGKIEVDLNSD